MTCNCKKKKRKTIDVKDICKECKHEKPGECCPKIEKVKVVVDIKNKSFDCSGLERK